MYLLETFSKLKLQTNVTMKLHLPKVLLAAVCTTGLAMAATEVTNDKKSYNETELTVNSNLVFDNDDISWNAPGGTMSGNGSISSPEYQGVEIVIAGSGTNEAKFVINKGVNITNAYMYFYDATVDFKNTVHNSVFEAHAGAVVNLTDTSLTGHTTYWLCDGGTIKRPIFEIQGTGTEIAVYSEYGSAYGIMDGNVIFNAGGAIGRGEKAWSWNSNDIHIIDIPAYISFDIDTKNGNPVSDYGTLEITGSLTIKSETAVVFWAYADYIEQDGVYYYRADYVIPEDDHCFFICSNVNENGLSLMKPYVAREDGWETEDDEGGCSYTKSLDDYAFYAVTGGDGRVYIYLGQGGTGSGSPIPSNAITISSGQTIVLGTSEDTTPGTDKPVYITGGTADASHLSDSLLSNKIILGNGGRLLTTGHQTMVLQGKGGVSYSILAAGNSTSAARLEIGQAGAQGNLELKGDRYESTEVAVNGGVLTVSSKTTLGLGSNATSVDVADYASITNYGKINGDITTSNSSTVLNQGSISGDIDVAKTAVLTNNGSISGTVTADGKVYGSGMFANTVVLPGALLHVGNSPGYQKHNTLTINRGATISFSVDGITPASVDKNGSDTHSLLQVSNFTVAEGDGEVTVNVDVTMGILAAGREPISLTLLEATTTNATEEDFTLSLNDESGLLEKGTTLSFDAGKLTLNGSVSKAALAALMDRNSANVANTMWASANAVHEFARTAENQFLIGMPGQTTLWGAGIVSFMSVSGSQGFTSNAGGYAVGMQHAFTEDFRAGVALGQIFGNFKSDDNQLKVDQSSFVPAFTAQYVTRINKSSSLTVNGHIAYGEVENEADTYQVGSAGKAEWKDKAFNAGVRVTWNVDLWDRVSASIFTGLTYQQVEQDSFTEKFIGGERHYRDGSMSSLSLPVGVTLRGIYQMDGTNIFVPELTLAYIGDVVRDNPEVKTSVYRFNRIGKGTETGRSTFMLNAGANWMFDSTWSIGAFYSLEARSNQVNQSVNAALRCSF